MKTAKTFLELVSKVTNDFTDEELQPKDTLINNPFEQFLNWFELAVDLQDIYPNSMALATADKTGKPAVRMVLLKDVTSAGFVFVTHYTSRKGQELAENNQAALLFYWPKLHKQIRVEGRIEKLAAEKSDVYFAGRTRNSQINAWASKQSQVLKTATELIDNTKIHQEKFQDQNIPRPNWWGGYVLKPNYFEFWQQGNSRFHKRQVFKLKGKIWQTYNLSP